MKINYDSLKKFSITGMDSTVTDGLAIGFMVFTIIHGVVIAIFKQPVIFATIMTVPFLALQIFAYMYAKKINPIITKGYNFLVLAIGSFGMSMTDLIASMVLIYTKTDSVKNVVILLLVFVLISVLFYVIVFLKMDLFNLKKKRSGSITGPAIGISGSIGVLTSLLSAQIMANISQFKLAVFFSIAFLIAALIWIFPTCLIIKFIYLKRTKMI